MHEDMFERPLIKGGFFLGQFRKVNNPFASRASCNVGAICPWPQYIAVRSPVRVERSLQPVPRKFAIDVKRPNLDRPLEACIRICLKLDGTPQLYFGGKVCEYLWNIGAIKIGFAIKLFRKTYDTNTDSRSLDNPWFIVPSVKNLTTRNNPLKNFLA
jgi:hypothetical protein